MSAIKDGINHICRRLDDIHGLLRKVAEIADDSKQLTEAIRLNTVGIRREIVTQNDMLNDFGEMLEELPEGKTAGEVTVKPVETGSGEKLFLVTGEELCNLLEACKGAKLTMKETDE